MALLLFVSLFILAISLGYLYLKRSYTLTDNNLPGAKPQIFFGNVMNSGLLTGKATFHEVLRDYQHRYGDKFVFWFGSEPFITFCLPEHAQTIFSDRHTFEQSPLFIPNFDLMCPNGLVVLEGARWKRHIRVILPVLRRAKVVQHVETIVECADRFIDRSLTDGQIYTDLVQRCQTFTMNVIGLIGFDYDLESSVDSAMKNALQDFISHLTLVVLIGWVPQWAIRLYLKFNGNYQRSRRVIAELMENIVKQEQDNQTATGQQRGKNLIASLVSSLNEQASDEQMSSGLTRSEIFDEVLMMLVAGFETTSTALSWFIFYMSKYPHVQERMRKELREHNLLMTDEAQCLPSLTQEKLDALIYCECVLKEVLRLAPVAGATIRKALRDTIVDNVRISRGQMVIIGLANINTDARYWHHDDPTKFIPERFLAEDKSPHPYAMIPFGGGHRSCAGQDLARLELKLIIVRLMQRGVTFEDTPENTGGFAERLACFPKKMAIRVHIDKH